LYTLNDCLLAGFLYQTEKIANLKGIQRMSKNLIKNKDYRFGEGTVTGLRNLLSSVPGDPLKVPLKNRQKLYQESRKSQGILTRVVGGVKAKREAVKDAIQKAKLERAKASDAVREYRDLTARDKLFRARKKLKNPNLQGPN
jgi:hypothetical protein